jgi:serine/threonine protein kinase/tetratricopeptide (TPR) repeat protein
MSTTAPQGGQSQKLEAGAALGRYVVRRPIGSGGMGVVYEADDPELDRPVAIKLLHHGAGGSSASSDGQVRLLREAQAMARLSHPHVVSVFDVGLHEGRVYVAMEYVEGQTLAQWLDARPRTVWEIIEVFVQAGRGLAAAHAAGLVHRDFKPDNVLVDGRDVAKVMDFGLVRSAWPGGSLTEATEELEPAAFFESREVAIDTPLTQEGVVVGTPSYMAPEQHVGRDPTAASDQYAFCAALFEALFGKRPFSGKDLRELAVAKTKLELTVQPRRRGVSSALVDIVMRGLSPQPIARFRSMSELLAQIERVATPRPSRRLRYALGGIAVAALGVALAVPARQQGCDPASAISGTWNEDVRAQVRESLRSNDVSYAASTADRVDGRIADYVTRWSEVYREACAVTGDARALDSSMRCLDERRFGLEATLTELQRPGSRTVQRAVVLAAELQPPERCAPRSIHSAEQSNPAAAEPGQSEEVIQAKRELERIGAMIRAGRFDEAAGHTDRLMEHVPSLDDPGLLARARVMQGELAMMQGRPHEAAQAWQDAVWTASEVGDDEVVTDAAGRLVFLYAEDLVDDEAAMKWARHAEVALKRWNDPGQAGQLAAARLQGSVAVAHSSAGRYDEALAAFEESRELKEQLLGPEHPEVAGATMNVGLTMAGMGQLPEAEQELARAHRRFVAALGGSHPDVGLALENLANVHSELGDQTTARREYEEALEIYTRAFGEHHPKLARTLDSLGWVEGLSANFERAADYHRRALKIAEENYGPVHREVASASAGLGRAAQALGRPEDARRHFERALDIARRVFGHDHDFTAGALSDLGSALIDLERYDEAEPLLKEGLQIRREVFGSVHPATAASLNLLGDLESERELWDAALAYHQQALPILEAVYGPDHPETLLTAFDLGYIALKQGRPEDAYRRIAAVEATLAAGDVHDPLLLADIRFHLAQAIDAVGGDRSRALELAETASVVFEANPEAMHDELDELEAFLARLRRQRARGKGSDSRQP